MATADATLQSSQLLSTGIFEMVGGTPSHVGINETERGSKNQGKMAPRESLLRPPLAWRRCSRKLRSELQPNIAAAKWCGAAAPPLWDFINPRSMEAAQPCSAHCSFLPYSSAKQQQRTPDSRHHLCTAKLQSAALSIMPCIKGKEVTALCDRTATDLLFDESYSSSLVISMDNV